ncbi:hypothetical protein [Herbaspirillum frisingense]|uniref:hypothetical protein n=1 Tax=Herbaspirillum frisingense TaxID=92645 RepID=UPI001F176FC6|nr:hypothetical protein [Herbaspirillum frisingense]UIN19446.1 hypothetical protein LAZ82_13125 [Herbaspirillum frisingense]
MSITTYTLIADGTSDRVLLPVINWVLDQIDGISYVPQYAEHTLRPSAGLLRRVESAAKIYECDVLFVHRDAEGLTFQRRIDEIQHELAALGRHYVPVVPVRMTEAWLLIDEAAIRAAAHNPKGKTPLNLPGIDRLESVVDPKELLFDKLRLASELSARRTQKFRPETCRHRVAELISDFSPLQKISSFRRFESDVKMAFDHLA